MVYKSFRGLTVFLGLMLVLTLSFSQFAFGGDSSVKVDNSLEALAHEDPLANVEMILVLKQRLVILALMFLVLIFYFLRYLLVMRPLH